MREDLEAKAKLEDIVKALEEKAAAGSSVNPLETPTATEAESNTTSEADIESLVEKTLQAKQSEALKAANLSKVDSELTNKFGDKASDMLQSKAKELGMSVEDMKGLAENSPAAVMAMFGESSPSFTAPRSSVNTAGMEHRTERKDWDYYQNMRRTNPKLYYTPKVQNELAKAYADGGREFGKR